jgi:hypothetical protein
MLDAGHVGRGEGGIVHGGVSLQSNARL